MGLFDNFRNASSSDRQREPDYYKPLRHGEFAAAIPLLRKAIRQDDAHAMAILATLLALGRGIEQDEQEAARWYRQSAVRGELAGQTAFGACLATGSGVPIDQNEAAYWLYRAARAGYCPAANLLADLALQNPSVVGEHFSETEFYAVLRIARQPKGTTRH